MDDRIASVAMGMQMHRPVLMAVSMKMHAVTPQSPQHMPAKTAKGSAVLADAKKDPNLWHSNGFLGGWVGAKSLVGEVNDAWKRMLASYDRKSDWSLEECTTGQPLDDCPKDKVRQQSFPEALKKLLESNDYPLPKGEKR